MNTTKYFNSLPEKSLSKEDEENATKDQLIRKNLKFVVQTAHKYTGNGLPLDDLIQSGNLGLIEAADKFDKNSGNKFITYAVYYIKMRMRKALNKHNNMIRQSHAHLVKLNKIKKFIKQYHKKYEKDPNIETIVENTGLSKMSVKNTLKYKIIYPDSIHKTISDDNKNNFLRLLPINKNCPYKIVRDNDNIKIIKYVFDNKLTNIEKEIIKFKFFEDKSIAEISRITGESSKLIKRHITNSINKFKQYIEK